MLLGRRPRWTISEDAFERNVDIRNESFRYKKGFLMAPMRKKRGVEECLKVTHVGTAVAFGQTEATSWAPVCRNSALSAISDLSSVSRC